MPNMKLIISIINFLKAEASKDNVHADTQESLEVAVQCLQTAYDLDSKDPRLTRDEHPLEEIFVNGIVASEAENNFPAQGSEAAAEKAELMKSLGNSLMRTNQFIEAIGYYTEAIKIDQNNAVYYCNRAAAYSKLNEFQNAIKDCEKAVELEPTYAKAYGRMGLAYTSLDQRDLAIQAFQKAVDIEPTNESYHSNLRLAQEKKEKPAPTTQTGLGGIANLDWNSLFSNPAFRNMASTVMQDPNIISAFFTLESSGRFSSDSAATRLSGGMANSSHQQTGSNNSSSSSDSNNSTPMNSSSSPIPGIGNASLDMLLEAGQYLAAQMQAANPNLVEQIRQSARNPNPPNQENKDSSGQ